MGRIISAKERALEERCFKELCEANPGTAIYMGGALWR